MGDHIENKLYILEKAAEIRLAPEKNIVTQPIISRDFKARRQVDLRDKQPINSSRTIKFMLQKA